MNDVCIQRGREMRIHRAKSLAFIAAILSLACIAKAQSQPGHTISNWLNCDVDWIFSEQTVGSDFSLWMSFHALPVAGVRISLTKDGAVVATTRTNSDGVAHFKSIPPGNYDPVSADGLLFPSSSLVIHVEAGHIPGEKVKLDWPNHSVATRNLRGKFTVSEQPDGPDIPLRNARVEILDPYTSKLNESGHTDINGDYEFATRIPGVYALRLTLAKKDELGSETRDLPVELDPTAKEYSIPEMKAVHSDCNGLQLLRRSGTEDSWEAQ